MFNRNASREQAAPRRFAPYVALIPVCLGVFVAADDQTVVVTVLPQIMTYMKVDVVKEVDQASWIITGYLLGYVAAMPLIGRVSDVVGHRRAYIACTVLFMAGSTAVALTTELSWLVAMRVLQAVGAGALVPISIAIVGDLFPPDRRGLPLGIVGGAAEAGGVIGPLWGGLIARYLEWQWIFWVNIPLSLLTIALLLWLVRPSPLFPGRIDYVGGALLAVALGAVTLGLARIGSPDTLMTAYLGASAAALVLFVLRQGRTDSPLIPLAIFRRAAISAANISHLFVGGALIIGMITVPLMASTALQLTPLEGGLRLMRMTAAMPLGAVLGGAMCGRFGYRVPTVAGLAFCALGYWLMSGWEIDVGDPQLTIHLATAGFGFGLVIAPITLAATNPALPGMRGAAAGLVTAMRVVGMTLGLATLAAWGAGRFQELIAGLRIMPSAGETAAQAQERFSSQLTDAGLNLFSSFFLIAMAACLIAIVPALFMSRDDADDVSPRLDAQGLPDTGTDVAAAPRSPTA